MCGRSRLRCYSQPSLHERFPSVNTIAIGFQAAGSGDADALLTAQQLYDAQHGALRMHSKQQDRRHLLLALNIS